MMENVLQLALTAARDAIGPDGELPYPWRKRIWAAFIDQLGSDLGIRAWSAVQVACAHRVRPVWHSTFPQEEEPMIILRAAEEGMASGVDQSGLESQFGSLKAFLDDKLTLGQEYFAGIYAGFACLAAAREVVYRREPPDISSELELDPDEWDASFYASLAEAGGAVWEEGVGDAEARRKYWKWFLEDPVPRAAAQFEPH